MTDKKKKYLEPEMKVVVLDQADIIATSNEGLGDGGNIFGGARGSNFDDEDF